MGANKPAIVGQAVAVLTELPNQQATAQGSPIERLIRERFNDLLYIAVIVIAAAIGYVLFDPFYQALLGNTEYLNLIDRNMYLALVAFSVIGLVLGRTSGKLRDMSQAGFGVGLMVALYLYLGNLIGYGGFGDPDLDPMLPLAQVVIGLIALAIVIGNGYSILKRFTIGDVKPVTSQPASPTISSLAPAAAVQAQAAPAPAPGVQIEKIIHEKETIREIVKVPCGYCGTLVEITATKCPSCGAPLKK